MAELAAETARAELMPGLAGLPPSRSSPPSTRQESVARVIAELNAFDPGLDVLVVDDGSATQRGGGAQQGRAS